MIFSAAASITSRPSGAAARVQRLAREPRHLRRADGHEAVAQLTEKFSAAQLAQAYLALHEARHSAPEELAPVTDRKDRKREPRVELGPSGWVSLSVGRKERAEPRWLLPMLLRSADLTKDEIGAIRVARDLTYVELGEKARARFLDQIGDGGEMEKGVRVAAVDELPDLPKPEPRKRFDDDRKPHRKRVPRPGYAGEGARCVTIMTACRARSPCAHAAASNKQGPSAFNADNTRSGCKSAGCGRRPAARTPR